ncbi:MAG: CARDB domain-containing protein [Nanoarchaeota archaeon]
MKTVTFLMSVFLISIVLSSTVVAIGDVDVTLAKQTPNPAEPGKILEVQLELENNEFGAQSDVTIELIEKDPFTLLPGQQNKKSFANIEGKSSVQVKYDLAVSASAPSNDYELELHVYTTSNPSAYVTKKVTINLEGDVKLILENVETVPVNIEPGGMVDIITDIKNVGTGAVTNMELTLNFSSSALVPILAKGSVYLDNLGVGETKQATFRLSVDTAAEYKTYIGTLTANYDDSFGVSRFNTFTLGVPVAGSIKLEIIKIEPIYDRDVLRIQLVNKGTAEAKSLEAKLYINDKLVDVEYVSLLKENKQTTLDYPLILRGSGELVINYIGPNLERIEVRKDVVLNYGDPRVAGTIGNLVFLVIVLIMFYFFIWKRYLGKHFGHKHHK